MMDLGDIDFGGEMPSARERPVDDSGASFPTVVKMITADGNAIPCEVYFGGKQIRTGPGVSFEQRVYVVVIEKRWVDTQFVKIECDHLPVDVVLEFSGSNEGTLEEQAAFEEMLSKVTMVDLSMPGYKPSPAISYGRVPPR